jgi:hypothetical protein
MSRTLATSAFVKDERASACMRRFARVFPLSPIYMCREKMKNGQKARETRSKNTIFSITLIENFQ